MPVEAPFRQAYLLHHRADAAAVTAVLAERASGHGKNVLVVLRFVFQGVPHGLKSTLVLFKLSTPKIGSCERRPRQIKNTVEQCEASVSALEIMRSLRLRTQHLVRRVCPSSWFTAA